MIEGIKTIETQYFNGRQSIEFEGIYQYKKHKLKVQIDIDSYDFQSSACVKIWNPKDLQWNFLAKIPWDSIESAAVHSYKKAKVLNVHDKLLFATDIKDLLTKATQII